MSSADIQKSAIGITFSNTSLLLTEVKWQKWRVFHVILIAPWERCANMVFSADDSFYQKFVPIQWRIGENF